MAGHYRYTAVLDACVLYPAPLRDVVLSFAAAGVFAARWTRQIEREWIRNLGADRPELSADALARTACLMAQAIEDCLIEDYDYLIDTLDLPDPDDRHVLAAAIVGHADAIVTFNLKDFPQPKVERHKLEILHPDDFLVAQYHLDQIQALRIIKAIRERLKHPPRTAEELVGTYEAQGLPQFSQLLRQAIELI